MSKEATSLEFNASNNEAQGQETIPDPTKKKTLKEQYFSYLLSKDFIIILLLGQLISLCETATIVTSNELSNNLNVNYPTTQSFLTYIVLFLIYTPITIYKQGFKGYFNMLKDRWWKYLILSFIDVEGNYFSVKAYAYTSLLSVVLLDAWSTPCVVILLIIFLKVKFHWSQYLAVLICLGGIAIVVASDAKYKEGYTTALNQVEGDVFCIISATFYGISNVLEEFFVRQRPLYEVVGQMGFWGTIISGVQLAIFERQEFQQGVWSREIIGMVIIYTVAMIIFYTCAPILFRLSSAAFFNLSLLTSDFYALIFALFLFHSPMYKLYPVAYVTTVTGLIIYNIYPATKPKIKGAKENELKEEEKDGKGAEAKQFNELV